MPTHPENELLVTSQDGIDLIKEFESFFANAYQDSGGVWTIGWGHTNNVSPGDTCTREEGEDWLKVDIEETETYVKGAVKVPVNQRQFDALVSLTFNMGIGNLMKSDVLAVLNRGNYDGACRQFTRHNRAKNKNTGELEVYDGLIRRRAAEMALWNLPIHVPADKSPVYPPLAKGEGGVRPDKPSDATNSPITDMVKHSTTVKMLLGVLTSLITLVAQMLEPLKKNPSAAIVLGLAVAGVGGALAWKYKDTKAGR